MAAWLLAVEPWAMHSSGHRLGGPNQEEGFVISVAVACGLSGMTEPHETNTSDFDSKQSMMDCASYTIDVHPPHVMLQNVSGMHEHCSKLFWRTLQSRALKDHVAFVPNSMLVTPLTHALAPSGAIGPARQH